MSWNIAQASLKHNVSEGKIRLLKTLFWGKVTKLSKHFFNQNWLLILFMLFLCPVDHWKWSYGSLPVHLEGLRLLYHRTAALARLAFKDLGLAHSGLLMEMRADSSVVLLLLRSPKITNAKVPVVEKMCNSGADDERGMKLGILTQ